MNSNLPHTKGPFRSRNGMLMGVIAGLAEYFGISRWLLRLVIVAISLLVAFWPVLIVYVISAFIMPLEPNYY
ncbi:MAG: PspC domain-containing protein [Deltaproteobacteria bacterium]|nr:PspC domain-containing protein [Deltaproteobacteria bacterium]